MENFDIRENIAPRKRCRVVSLFPDVLTNCATVASILQLIQLRKSSYICVSTVHMVMEAYDDPEFAAKVNAADLIVTDGMPLVWMQKLQGSKLGERFRGNDLTVELMKVAEKKAIKIGFYGGKPEVVDRLVERAQSDFPALEIAFSLAPPFSPLSEEEDGKIIDEINSSGVQILFVGLGCPKQETWMSAHRDKISAVMIGVGAAFDFYAGNVAESPRWLSDLGFEWLYRLLREPGRLWRRYLILNPRFIVLAARQLLTSKRSECAE